MKHVIFIAALALVLGACGKNNSTSSGTSTVTNPISGTTTVAVTDFTTFKTKVSNGEFYAQGFKSVNFIFEKYETKLETDTHKFLGIPFSTSSTNTKYIGQVTRSFNTSTGVLVHEKAVNLAALIVYLKDIVNNASSSYACQNNYGATYPGCYVVTKGNVQYRIDLNSPIAANPTAIYEKVSDTSATYLNWKTISNGIY